MKHLLIFLGVVIAAVWAFAGKKYPLDTCIVTDNKLGSMGTPITKTYKGQDVKFCCRPCIKKFYQNPDKYMEKLK